MVNHVKLKIDYRIFELCTPRCVIESISYLKSPVVPVKGISKTLYDGLVCRGYSTNRMLEPMDTFLEDDFFDFEELTALKPTLNHTKNSFFSSTDSPSSGYSSMFSGTDMTKPWTSQSDKLFDEIFGTSACSDSLKNSLPGWPPIQSQKFFEDSITTPSNLKNSCDEFNSVEKSFEIKMSSTKTNLLRIARYRPIEDILPLIMSLVGKEDRIDDAEFLYENLRRIRLSELRRCSGASLQNIFLHHYHCISTDHNNKAPDQTGSVRRAHLSFGRWQDLIFSGTDCSPDAMTFAIILRHLAIKKFSVVSETDDNFIQRSIRSLFELMRLEKIDYEKSVVPLGYLDPKILSDIQASLQNKQPVSERSEFTDFEKNIESSSLGQDISHVLGMIQPQDESNPLEKDQAVIEIEPVRQISSRSQGISYLRHSMSPISSIDFKPMISDCYARELEASGYAPSDRLKDTLSVLDRSVDKNIDLYTLQEKIERECYTAACRQIVAVRDELRKVNGGGIISHEDSMRRLICMWHTSLSRAIQNICSNFVTLPSGSSLNLDLNPNRSELHESRIDAPKSVNFIESLDSYNNRIKSDKNNVIKYRNEKHAGTHMGDAMFSSIISCIESEIVALIVLQEMIKASSYDVMNRSVPFVRLASEIGGALEREIYARQISKKSFLRHTDINPRMVPKIVNSRALLQSHMRRQLRDVEKSREALREGWVPSFSNRLRCELGSWLIGIAISNLRYSQTDLLIDPRNQCLTGSKIIDSKVSESTSSSVDSCSKTHTPSAASTDDVPMPVFTHKILQKGKNMRLGVVSIENQSLFALMSTESSISFVRPWALPMVVPPRPWLTYQSGGYLTQRHSCVRMKDDPLQTTILREADGNGKMTEILRGLDVLGMTAWAINVPVLRTALKLWNGGIDVSNLSTADLSLIKSIYRTYGSYADEFSLRENIFDDKSTPSSHKECTSIFDDKSLNKKNDFEEFKFRARESFSSNEEFIEYVRRVKAQQEDANKAHSSKCNTGYRLEIARQFARTGLPFYLPHSVDFRGRAYPIPPHLTHLGCDLSRGLLRFAEGHRLGPNGLRWLKIQLSNSAGFDKASFDARIAFVDENLSAVLKSASDPLSDEGSWWRRPQHENPWQCLAACFEIAEALKFDKPEEFISYLPVQQDGSCNGLQHYAALGRDVEGGREVNLISCLQFKFPDSTNKSPEEKNRIESSLGSLVDPNGLSKCTRDCESGGEKSNVTENIGSWIIDDELKNDQDMRSKVAVDEGPKDVYEAIAKLVNEKIEKDALASTDGLHIACKLRGGKVTRRIVKQPVMTNVYGVTRYGASQQVFQRLRDDPVLSVELSTSPGDMRKAKNYVSDCIFASLGTIFSRASRIQLWLQTVAAEIARSVPFHVALRHNLVLPESHDGGRAVVDRILSADKKHPSHIQGTTNNINLEKYDAEHRIGNFSPQNIGEDGHSHEDDPSDRFPQTSVCWTTPLGFEAMQPYIKSSTISLRTGLQTISLRSPSVHDVVDAAKQIAAYPPNFIHSLDATHMFKTALECFESSITFASVHDCFWTHAGTVDSMRKIIREQFVAMHREPILENLRDELLQRYANHYVPILRNSASKIQRIKSEAIIFSPLNGDKLDSQTQVDDPQALEEEEVDEDRPRKVLNNKGKEKSAKKETDFSNKKSNSLKHMDIRGWRPINIPELPPRGDLNIESVLDSRYFFS